MNSNQRGYQPRRPLARPLPNPPEPPPANAGQTSQDSSAPSYETEALDQTPGQNSSNSNPTTIPEEPSPDPGPAAGQNHNADPPIPTYRQALGQPEQPKRDWWARQFRKARVWWKEDVLKRRPRPE